MATTNELGDSVAELESRVGDLSKSLGDIARAVVALGDVIHSLAAELPRMEKRIAGQIALSATLTHQANPQIFSMHNPDGKVWGQGVAAESKWGHEDTLSRQKALEYQEWKLRAEALAIIESVN